MRALIVGCGYVGLPLAAELARRGHDVFGVRRNPDARAELEAAGIHPVFADVTRPADLAALPVPFDWVVNCVASGGGGAADYRRLYLEGTRNLLSRLAAAAPRKFVYTSSTSVYGQTDGSVVDETSPAEPVAESARVLVETENVLLDAARQIGFPAVILRVAGIYGPGRGYWLRQFLTNQAQLEGTGGRMLNMIHRDDAVGCILAALEEGRAGEIYNAVDDGPVRQIDFFAWVAQTLGKPGPTADAESVVRPGKRGVTSKAVSNRKSKAELGYRFKFPTFREGCAPELRRLTAD